MNQFFRSGSSTAGGGAGKFADLKARVASAAALAGAALATLYIGGDLFTLFWLLAALAVSWEWQGLIGGDLRSARIALGSIALVAAAAFVSRGAPNPAIGALVAFSAVLAAQAGQGRRLWAAGGLFYAGSLVVSACLLRQSPQFGLLSIAWLFAVVWGTDVMAYFGGRIIGGPKLWPSVSPGKTWSGTIVGVVSGALSGLAVAAPTEAGAALFPLFAIGIAAAISAQLGDLFESAIKRRFGVKDSSRLIPGHGGVMDRLDGFIFASAFAALFGSLRDPSSAAAGLFIW